MISNIDDIGTYDIARALLSRLLDFCLIAIKSVGYCIMILLVLFLLRVYKIESNLNEDDVFHHSASIYQDCLLVLLSLGLIVSAEFIIKLIYFIIVPSADKECFQKTLKILVLIATFLVAVATLALPFAGWLCKNTGIKDSLTYSWIITFKKDVSRLFLICTYIYFHLSTLLLFSLLYV